MAGERTPILQVPTGTKTTDYAGEKIAMQYFQLYWGSETRPGGVFLKALMHVSRYPGSTDELHTVLRLYDGDGALMERDARDIGKVRESADAFEKSAEMIENGTPLGVLNLDPAKIDTLKGKGVFTVEALRDVPDARLGDLGMGSRALQRRAIDFLDGRDRNADLAKVQDENQGLRDQMKAQEEVANDMKAELRALRQQVDGLAPKKKAG